MSNLHNLSLGIQILETVATEQELNRRFVRALYDEILFQIPLGLTTEQLEQLDDLGFYPSEEYVDWMRFPT